MPQPVQAQVHSGGVVVAPYTGTWLERFGTGLGQLAQALSVPFSIMDMMEKTQAYKMQSEAAKTAAKTSALAEALKIADPEERRDFLKALGVMSDEDLERYYQSYKGSPQGTYEGAIKTQAMQQLFPGFLPPQAPGGAPPAVPPQQQEIPAGQAPTQPQKPPAPATPSASPSSGVQALREVLVGKKPAEAAGEVVKGTPAKVSPLPDRQAPAPGEESRKAYQEVPEPVVPALVALPNVPAAPAEAAKQAVQEPVESVLPTPVDLNQVVQSASVEMFQRASQPVHPEALKAIEQSEEFQSAKEGFQWLERNQPDFIGPIPGMNKDTGLALKMGLGAGVVYNNLGAFLSQVPPEYHAIMAAATEEQAGRVLRAFYAQKGIGQGPSFEEVHRLAAIYQKVEKGAPLDEGEKSFLRVFDRNDLWYKRLAAEGAMALRAMGIDAEKREMEKKALESDTAYKAAQAHYYQTRNETELETARMQYSISKEQLAMEGRKIDEMVRQFELQYAFNKDELERYKIPMVAAEMLKARAAMKGIENKSYERLIALEDKLKVDITHAYARMFDLINKYDSMPTHPVYMYTHGDEKTKAKYANDPQVKQYLDDIAQMRKSINSLEAQLEEVGRRKIDAAARDPDLRSQNVPKSYLTDPAVISKIKFPKGVAPIPTRTEYLNALGGDPAAVSIADMAGLSLMPQKWNGDGWDYVTLKNPMPDSLSDLFLNKVIIPNVRAGKEKDLPQTREEFVQFFAPIFTQKGAPGVAQKLPLYWEHYRLHLDKALQLKELIQETGAPGE